ncbi:hypothetical protein Tsubulata_030843 [Turnera subulata]|uniref:S-protein homolog n=1 Tax=Turnera subulata TaxID=218843 RepID=A0A9Q0GIL1_9ROSI|nr:hypothetical protein Tsubulata_030843 [Turnera subulata]
MTTPWGLFLLFLNLAFLFSAAIPTKNNTENQATVYIINALPPNSGSMQVSCSLANTSGVNHNLLVSEEYRWNVEAKRLYECLASRDVSGRYYFRYFNAYQPPRDKDHDKIFWLVTRDGFYLSWDKVKWVRKAEWDSE